MNRSPTFHRRCRLALALFWTSVLLAAAPPPAVARVSPLRIIQRQIHRPNMLILLDTSGSMTGVPGGVFSSSSEVGVDCDDGVNCRGATAAGTCSASNRPCSSDATCQMAYCQTGGAACAVAADCATGTCSITGDTCAADANCPVQTNGTCNPSGDRCTPGNACPTHNKCSQGSQRACNNPGGACTYGTCAIAAGIECNTSSDCPRAATGGTCTQGGSPPGGCNSDADCPLRKRCVTGENCAVVADCPNIAAGTCSLDNTRVCTRDRDCRGGRGTCVIPAKSCTGIPNTCTLPATACNLFANNICNTIANNCEIPQNRCGAGPVNPCMPPIPGDVCNANVGVAGALRMCRISQSLCTKNADCTTAGDACGPPTSRTVVAKRTLSKIITDNSSIINLGLMTFYQSGYFPYFKINAGAGNTTERRYFGRGGLEDKGCFDMAHGPSATCNYQGVLYTLAPTPNSVYQVNQGRNVKNNYDQDFCGKFCTVPGVGTGKWQGSYYVRTVVGGTLTTTKSVQPTYQGQNLLIGGLPYHYYVSRPDYYNGGPAPPISIPNCGGGSCSASCGARWDDQLAPFLDPMANEQTAMQHGLAMLQAMESASEGGLITYGGTPSGCALENTGASNRNASAYHYMQAVKNADTLPCRDNFVLFITDGEANGPGDSNCSAAACGAADPVAAGCTCRAVLSAFHMKKNLGVKTFVVGFSTDVSQGNPKITNDNIARAGGTDKAGDGVAPFAFTATNEEELIGAIQGAIYDAVKGSYSTSQATSSSGTQQPLGIQAGTFALDSRVDFPSWQGHLLAYDVSIDPPVLAWDAAARLKAMNWWERRIYLGGPNGAMVKILVDPATKSVTNRADLAALGMGSSPDEAERVARFTMGDPLFKNPAVLGAIINSTPIDVGQPGDNPAPGGHEFFVTNKRRTNLTYVGSDDGMLHAFFSLPTIVAGTAFPAGSEAFAYIPPGMLKVVTRIFAQGGQVADPSQHIFGLANSPKVKNLCVRNCADAASAIWKTLLVMPEGFGGDDMFMLDITNPVSSTGFADPPVAPIWHTDDGAAKASYDDALGLTISVPGFFFTKTDSLNDHRLIMASGYRDGGGANAGRQIVVASAASGEILDRQTIVPAGACAQEYTMLADVATAKDFAKDQRGKLLGAYVGDTWGRLWRYTPTGANLVTNLGCQAPLHFAPTVVQLDRDDPSNYSHELYLVQVTNSPLDEVTENFAPSKMIIMREKPDGGGILGVDALFGTAGKIVLTAGQADGLCGMTNPGGGCATPLPASARPMGTPTAILKRDGSGFQIISLWYVPDANGCSKGTTYLALHEVVNGAATQKQGLKIANEPVTSPVVAAGRIFVISSQGAMSIDGDLAATFVPGTAQSPRSGVGVGRFNILGWTEL